MKCITLLGVLLLSCGSLLAQEPDNPTELIFSVEGGFFPSAVEVDLYAPGAEIYYTLDGSWPSRRARRFEEPIRVDRTTVIRAVAYRGGERGSVFSQTYFIGEPPTSLPVVSIGITPALLFDPQTGLFLKGPTSDSTRRANYYSREELPVSLEIYETDGRCVYNSLSGFRLFGGISRLFPQKSLAVVARKEYGEKRIRHEVFGPEGPDAFKFLVLRNSGSDFGKSHFRDALMTSIVADWDLDVQLSHPALVYINGTYWGVYHIREKINRYFLAEHHDVDKDSLDLMEHQITRKLGSVQHYYRLLRFLERNSLDDPANYAAVRGMMEVDNYLDHQIAQIYFDNRDAGGNIRYWRPQTPEGRWRWILYDTDWGMGLHDADAYAFNSLAFHTRADGPAWPNPPWSTLILRKLLENPSFRQAFLNRFADHLNTSLLPAAVLERLEAKYQELAPEMPRHFERWRLSRERWELHVDRMREFAWRRPEYMWGHLADYFNTGPPVPVKIGVTPGGKVVLNEHLHLQQETFAGNYFSGLPLSLRAVPNVGYRFVGWEGSDLDSGADHLVLTPDRLRTGVRAVFEPYDHPLAGKVLINEISPNNKKTKDWLELFNHSDERVSLRGWVLRDAKGNTFEFPGQSYLDPNDYLVICEDSARFLQEFPRSYNVISGMDFGLNKHRETLELYSADLAAIDSVGYVLPPTDSTFTLSLLLPRLDNADQENWRVNPGRGTPNAPNPYYVASSIRKRQAQWMQIGVAGAVVLLCVILLYWRQEWKAVGGRR